MSSNKNYLKEEKDFYKSRRRRITRAALTGATALIIRGSTVGVNFISIPLTARYLGTERFGLWLTLSTFLSWINIADLGLANSLTNVIAYSDGQNDIKLAKEAVSSAFWVMVIIAITLSTLFIVIYPWIRWSQVFNLSSIPIGLEAGLAVLIGFFFFTLRLPLSIPSKIYEAYQEGYFYQLWTGLCSWLSLIGLLVSIHFQVGLPVLIGVLFGTSLLADIFSALHLFCWRRPTLKPNYQNFSFVKSKLLLKTGIQFWVIQVSAIALYQTDLIIMTQLFGPREVASYGVVLKLFSLIGVVQSAFLAPLWPAYTEAFARKDIEWITTTFKFSMAICLAWSTCGGIVLYYISPWIISLWVNKEAIPNQNLVSSLFFVSILTSLGQCIAFVMNGIGRIKSQVFIGIISGILNLVISIFLGKFIGVIGVVYGTIISVIFGISLVANDTYRYLKKIHNILDR